MCSFTGPEDFCVWIAGHVSLKNSTEGFRHSCHCELLPGDASSEKGKEQPKGKGAEVRLSCWAKLPLSAGAEGLCNAQEHFGTARRRFPSLSGSVGKNLSQGTKAGTSKPAGKIVKTDQIPQQGSFPAAFPLHWNTRFRLIKQSGEDMKQ